MEVGERCAGSLARNPTQGVRSTQRVIAARLASDRAISAAKPPTLSAQRSPSSASATQSIEGVLIVSPRNRPGVMRKILGNGQVG